MSDAPSENPLGAIKASDVADSLKRAEVLVVDDSRLMRSLLTKSLTELGFTNINQAVDGRDAINKLLEKPYDIMLLDMEMPEMNGLEVLAAMNFDYRLKGTPTIVISSNEQTDLAVQCIEAGAEDYLIKPPNPTLLRARVMSSLEKNAFATLINFASPSFKRRKNSSNLKRKSPSASC
jgi:sigma-B regulation protein RsbU (phosphoserine phosphatase)